MTWLNTGADIGTMVTGVSAATAAYVWARNQVHGWRDAKASRKYRYWNGFILSEGIITGFIRMVPDPEGPTERVAFDVINPDDQSPNPEMAHTIRTVIGSDGMVSRSPSLEQMDFLNDLRRERFGRVSGFRID
jgi:hypothetical protein